MNRKEWQKKFSALLLILENITSSILCILLFCVWRQGKAPKYKSKYIQNVNLCPYNVYILNKSILTFSLLRFSPKERLNGILYLDIKLDFYYLCWERNDSSCFYYSFLSLKSILYFLQNIWLWEFAMMFCWCKLLFKSNV